MKRKPKKICQCALLILFLHILLMNMLQAQNTSFPVGAIPGTIDVSPNGAATYTIPIEVVPGTQGMQPNLSIVYNSLGGMGLLGMKWNLAGLSTITRCGKTPYFDGSIEKIIFNNGFEFTLDGERLIQLSSSNREYATEVEDFSRVYANSDYTSFTAYTDNGGIINYGTTDNSRQKMGKTDNILSWLVDKITDADGNYMTFQYLKPHTDEEVLIRQIDYTYNSNISPYAQVFFKYRDLPERMGKNTYFVSGYKVQQTQLLDSIIVYYGTTVVRKYGFVYNIGEQDQPVAQLKSIVLFGEGGKQQLNATNIAWQKQTKNEDTRPIVVPSISEAYNIITGDFDGDGYMDYLVYYPGFTKRYFGTESGEFIAENSGGGLEGSNLMLYKADVDGDGRDELINLDYNVDNCTVSINAYGTTVSATLRSIQQLFFGDFNGDGKTDILFLHRKNGINNDGEFTFTLYNASALTKFQYNTGLLTTKEFTPPKVRVGDFNGYGKTDVEVILANGTMNSYSYGESGFSKLNSPPSATYAYNRYSGDFNGDGITDLLTYDIYGGALMWKLSFGIGNGTYTNATNVSGLSGSAQTNSTPMYAVIIADMDGDGKDDILQFTPNTSVKILYSQGCVASGDNYTFLYKEGGGNISGFKSLADISLTDFNNDGYLDFVVQKNENLTAPSVSYIHKSYDLTDEITDGLGKVIKLTYKPRYMPANDFRMSRGVAKKYFHFLMKEMKVANGVGTTNSFLYNYDEATFSTLRRCFLGFKKFVTNSVQDDRKDIFSFRVLNSSYSNGYEEGDYLDVLVPELHETFYKLEKYSTITYDIWSQMLSHWPRYAKYDGYKSIDNHLSQVKTIYRDLLDDDGRLLNARKEIGYTKHTTKTPDYECHFLEVKTYTYKTVNLSTHQHKTVPTEIITRKAEVNKSKLPWIADTLTYSYNNKGQVTQMRQSNAYGSITTTYKYLNPPGVCTEKTVLAPGCTPRTELYTYDNSTRRFVTQITNSQGHISFFSYDPKNGNKLTEKDPNNLTTTYQYDKFGNLTLIKYPDNTQTNTSIKWCLPSPFPNAIYQITSTTTAKPELITYYDMLGREVCRKEDGYYFKTIYNSIGQVVKTMGPHSRLTSSESEGITHTYFYDIFGRKKEETAPYSHLFYTYERDRTTIENDTLRNFTRRKSYDYMGRTLSSDNVFYCYYVDTVPKKRQHIVKFKNAGGGFETSIASDLWGNRLVIDDPNAGRITSAYNGFNELYKQIDARKDTTTYLYDNLGRITQKRFAAPNKTPQTIHYIYDTAPYGIGKLHQIKINDTVVETFTYDNLSRLATHSKVIDNYVFTFKYTYNSLGQLDILTYPEYSGVANFSIKYTYTATGKIQEIKRCNEIGYLYKTGFRNNYNALTNCDFGNDVRTDYSYNPYGLLTQIKTGKKLYYTEPPIPQEDEEISRNGNLYLGTDSSIVNYCYAYDNLGLMNYRLERRLNMLEQYEYDKYDRLTKISSGTVNTVYDRQTFDYNFDGNITHNSKLGNYEYGLNIKPVNAVKSITTNAISDKPCTVSYNFFNQPTEITEGDDKYKLYYGADQQRNKTVKYKNGEKEYTRLYFNKYFEMEENGKSARDKRFYYYVYGDDGVVAVRIAKTASPCDSIYYIHTDHLGSYCAITNANRKIVQRENFDPWGNYIPRYIHFGSENDTTAVVTDVTMPGVYSIPNNFNILRRGFTGHEHYPEMHIINMNARLYDPVIARFFSPDNFIQIPENSQALNRYSYCLNNPLMMKDPTGQSFVKFLDDYGLDRNTGRLSLINKTNDDFDVIYTGTFGTDNKFTKDGNSKQFSKGLLNAKDFKDDLSKRGFATIDGQQAEGIALMKFISFEINRELSAWGYRDKYDGLNELYINSWDKNKWDFANKPEFNRTGKAQFLIHTHPGSKDGLGGFGAASEKDYNFQSKSQVDYYILSRQDGLTRYDPSKMKSYYPNPDKTPSSLKLYIK